MNIGSRKCLARSLRAKNCDTISPESEQFWTNERCYKSCCNCAANKCLRTNYMRLNESNMHDELIWLAKLAAKLRFIYLRCDEWRAKTARDDMMEFMLVAVRSMMTDHGDQMMAMKKDLMKQVSHYGGIRVASHMVTNSVVQSQCAAFTYRRQIIISANKTKRVFYQLIYDGGNVAYHDYVKKIVRPDDFLFVDMRIFRQRKLETSSSFGWVCSPLHQYSQTS